MTRQERAEWRAFCAKLSAKALEDTVELVAQRRDQCRDTPESDYHAERFVIAREEQEHRDDISKLRVDTHR